VIIIHKGETWEALVPLEMETHGDGGMVIWPHERWRSTITIDTCEHCHRSTYRQVPAASLANAAERGWVRKVDA